MVAKDNFELSFAFRDVLLYRTVLFVWLCLQKTLIIALYNKEVAFGHDR